MKSLLKCFMWGLLFLFIAMLISYIFSQYKLKKLTPAVRSSLPGDFIQLKDGIICYYWKGPENGNIVVLVHGISTPKFVWDGNVDALIKAGNRILAYDHFGRGFSDRPDVKYDSDFYDRELLNLLDAFNIKEPVCLVGYSMGGGNVVGFASRHPERVKKLILIAPVGYLPEYRGIESLALIPGIGDWLMAVFGKGSMLADIKKEINEGTAPPNMLDKFEEQFQYKGYLQAILSTMRHYPMNDLSKKYENVGKFGIPTFAIWGTEDKVVPFSCTEKVKKAIPQIKIFPIEGAAHSVTYARTKEVNRILVHLLSQ